MIGTCYRKMNLFNEAHKIYEDVYNLYPDNLDNLRMLVQIRKDLGLKFQDLMQKVMALDRQNEMMQQQQNPGYGQGYGGMDVQDMRQQIGEMPDMTNIQPTQKRTMAQRDDGDWDDVDAGGLLD